MSKASFCIKMMLEDDLKTLLDDLAEWRKSYSRKCNEIKELTAVIEVLKNEVRISKENEKRIQSHLNSKQEHIIQLQEILAKFSEERERNIKLNQENEKLKEEVEKLDKKYKEEEEKWKRIKLDLTENYETEINLIKQTAKQDAIYLKMDIAKLNESNAKTVESLKNELEKKEDDHKRAISQTISSYEEELSKMNGDLASAQTEIKLLRERCAANMNLYNNIEVGKFVMDQNEEYKVYGKPRYEPLKPIITGQSQIIRNHSYTPKKTLPSETYQDPQMKQTINRKTKLTAIRKRKLYSPTDEII